RQRRLQAMRTRMCRVAAIAETDEPFIFVPSDPFVTGLAAHTEAPTQRRNAQVLLAIRRNEQATLFHGTGLLPRHELLQAACRPVTHHPGLLCYPSSRVGPARHLPRTRIARGGGKNFELLPSLVALCENDSFGRLKSAAASVSRAGRCGRGWRASDRRRGAVR